MAHQTQVIGTVSELTAARALLANGWEVSLPMVPERYDLVAKDPVDKKQKTIQVKTIRRRGDRANEMVVYATDGKGRAYTPDSCDLIVGIEGDTAYMFENAGKKEYWASETSAAKRWIKFDTDGMMFPSEGAIK